MFNLKKNKGFTPLEIRNKVRNAKFLTGFTPFRNLVNVALQRAKSFAGISILLKFLTGFTENLEGGIKNASIYWEGQRGKKGLWF